MRVAILGSMPGEIMIAEAAMRTDQLIHCRSCRQQVVFIVTPSENVLPCGFKPLWNKRYHYIEVECPICRERNRYELKTVA